MRGDPPRVLIIGAGIAGMQAALDIANSGFQVTLVEGQPSIGGHMAQLSETFPTLDCAQCIMTPRTVEVGRHPNIQLITYAGVEHIEGEIGRFRARIRRRAAGVNWDVCTGCGVCTEKCPTRVRSDFDMGMGQRKAIRTNADVLDKLNAFLERPEPYAGQVEVRHILDILVHEVGLEAVAQRAQPGLKGLRAAAYYGCMLLRPADEIRLDDPERPHLMDDLLRALGAEVVEYPHGGECCGAYLSVTAPDVSMEMAHRILHSARRAGAQVIATACPLCQFNLDRPQNRMLQQYAGFQTLPVMYLTQLMAIAFGLEGRGFDLDAHYIDPRPVLAEAGLLAPISTAMEEA